jgi:hypothetical protein
MMKRLRSLCPPLRGYFRSQVGRLSIAGLRQPIGQPCHFGGGSDEGGIACLRGVIDKGCTWQRLDGAIS